MDADGEHRVPVRLGERAYDIVVRPGLLAEIGPRLRALGLSGKVAVVTDPPVARLYGARVARSLRSVGYEPRQVVITGGERGKTLRAVAHILDELARARFERGSLLVALGGGVVGDVAGFAAAVYVRGIPFVQVPTTLVAQVDSSVGGKTGVNHALGKNLIGAFHQPRAVLIDPETLRTLPPREWIAGLAEVIKYGMIADETFFAYLEGHMDALLKMEREPVIHVIARSCEIKAAVVGEDEREADRRRILNYGHTIGHVLESLGRYRSLLHGEAVAVGMVQEADVARHLGLCAEEVVLRQRALVRAAGLPDALPPVTFEQLWSAMQHDKKVVRGRIHCVLPERIGRVAVAPLERAAMRRWFATCARVTGRGPRARRPRAGHPAA
ncbi:3-dehydroquinate synthase [Nitrospira sp. Kam-Ns4a]